VSRTNLSEMSRNVETILRYLDLQMAANLPLEWVSGRSQILWYVGLLAVLYASFAAAMVGLDSGLSWAGIALGSSKLVLVLQLTAIGLAAGPMFLWAAAVPMPASRLGVSPIGIVVDYGLGSKFIPWERAYVRDGHLEVLSRRVGIRTKYSLTPLQLSRIASLRTASA